MDFSRHVWAVKLLFTLLYPLSQFSYKGKSQGELQQHWQAATELKQETRGWFFKAFQSESVVDLRPLSDATAATSY